MIDFSENANQGVICQAVSSSTTEMQAICTFSTTTFIVYACVLASIRMGYSTGYIVKWCVYGIEPQRVYGHVADTNLLFLTRRWGTVERVKRVRENDKIPNVVYVVHADGAVRLLVRWETLVTHTVGVKSGATIVIERENRYFPPCKCCRTTRYRFLSILNRRPANIHPFRSTMDRRCL